MQPTMSAAPYFLASGTTLSSFSGAILELIELMIDLPWQYVRAFSTAAASVLSMTNGTFTMRMIFS